MKATLSILFFILFFNTYSQFKQKIESLLEIKPTYISKLNNPDEKNKVYLRMDFDSPVIVNPEDAKILSGAGVLSIELYFTAFQVSESFSQPKLNKERFENLKKLCPDLFKQSIIQWKVIGQTGCKNETIAKTYFHGFVITYLPKPDASSVSGEVSYFNNLVNSPELGHDSIIKTKTTRLKTRKIFCGYEPVLKYKREKGIVYKKKGIFNRKPKYEKVIDTLSKEYANYTFVPSGDYPKFIQKLTDTTVLSVLNRNNRWKNMSVICDVTGSMSPYTSQLLMWHKLNCKTGRTRHFTFFNDGDYTPDNKKVIGKTGGVYCVAATDYKAVDQTMTKAMMSGGGGDCPENDCEALLKAIAENPESDEYILIADNYANIKDISLASKIKKPIRIILCGYNGFINLDYLNLARITGGSIHTLESDLENLASINEGGIFEISGRKYILKKGQFEPLATK